MVTYPLRYFFPHPFQHFSDHQSVPQPGHFVLHNCPFTFFVVERVRQVESASSKRLYWCSLTKTERPTFKEKISHCKCKFKGKLLSNPKRQIKYESSMVLKFSKKQHSNSTNVFNAQNMQEIIAIPLTFACHQSHTCPFSLSTNS